MITDSPCNLNMPSCWSILPKVEFKKTRFVINIYFAYKTHNTIIKKIIGINHWAIPEIRCTPPKEDMGIPKILTTFFIGKSKKIEHFFGCKGKEDMGIPKIFNHF